MAGEYHGSIYHYDLGLEGSKPAHLIGLEPNNPIPGDCQRVRLLDVFVEPGYPSSVFTIAFIGGGNVLVEMASPASDTCPLFQREGIGHSNGFTLGASMLKQEILSKP